MQIPTPVLLAGSLLLVAAVVLSGCVQDNTTTGQAPGIRGTPAAGSEPGPRGQAFHPNLTAAAAKLGVTEQDLQKALNITFQGRRNLTVAAQQLGVTTRQLADAMGFSFNASMPNGSLPRQPYRQAQG